MSEFDPEPAADALAEARRTRRWLARLPGAPSNAAQAYAIQDRVALSAGPITGWKVGAASATAEPFRAPIHASTFFEDRHLPAVLFHLVGVEAELVYRFGRDLPPRDSLYTESEVMDAVVAIHPAIEIVDTRFTVFGEADSFSQRADQQNHGALAIGPALADWRGVDAVRQPVSLRLSGDVAHQGIGGNSAGDPIRLLVWLANIGAVPLGGLRAGHAVTTGSCTGTIFARIPVTARADFRGVGAVDIVIE